MATDNEPAKLLLPYLQRADELQKHEPLVAYYCRLYAMERGLKIPQSDRTKTTNSLLISLMKQLEKDKKSLKLGPDDHLHLEGFALNVFAKADKQDRAGRADLNVAKTFYAASIFFEILNQFGELPSDLEQKQKYAAWKAADIRKAVKEGRKPLPGPPGGDIDLQVPSRTSSGEYEPETSRGDIAARPDLSREDPAAKIAPDSDTSPQVYDQDNFQSVRNVLSPSSSFAATPSPSLGISGHPHPPSSFPPAPSPSTGTSVPPHQPSSFLPTPSPSPSPSSRISPPPHYSTVSYSSDNPHQQRSPLNSQNAIYHHQSYIQEPYPQEPQQHLPPQYPSHDAPLSYPNFQSYPSFTDSSLPTAPSHYPSYSSYINSIPSNAAFPSNHPQHNPSSRNESVPEASPPTRQIYKYDSSYQPPPEKIAEAHKAARFAVGALAFDDVSVAVEYLKKSLELLTNPSAGH